MSDSAFNSPLASWRHFAQWLLRQAVLVTAITLIISLALVLVFHQAWGPTLVYCFFITVCCSITVQGLRHVLAWVRDRVLQRDDSERSDWPGWPLMVVSLVVGTFLGYSLGIELANVVTGFNERGLLNADMRRLGSIMTISLIPGFALTFFFLSRHRLAQAEARAQTLQRQAAETQLRLLESQLEPHMLFNTLANLRVLIGLDAARAQAMLDHLIAFLRATLAASRAERHALKDEFARLADYLALMQVRMGARLRFEFELPPELADLPVPPLLLQPLVENAIKHGLEPHVEGGLLRVSASRHGPQLRLDVQDDGRGLDPQATPSPGGGFGLQQVRERLAVSHGPAASLQLSARPEGGTLARLEMPLPA